MRGIANYMLIILISICFSGIKQAAAQWEEGAASIRMRLPEVALIDIEPDNNNHIHFTMMPVSESGVGELVQVNNDNDLFVNYSSSLAQGNHSRTIYAEIFQGELPQGVRLFIEAMEFAGIGRGKHGVPTGQKELTSQPVAIITGIKNSFTGDGINNGHRLEFTVEVADYSSLISVNESVISVLYTLSDN